MKDEILAKIVFLGQPSSARQKAGRPQMAWQEISRKVLREMGTSWEGVKREAWNRFG